MSGAIAAGSSWAQQQAANQPVLTEIIVTAEKREQNIQDVPISVIALSSQQLKDAGVTDIKDMQVLTPGLTVTSTTNESSTTARIRGIGTVGDNPGLESSVGVVIDGVYRPRNGVGFGNLGEIEQIEVLEGPQGELFGKNNDAGVIVITTKRPSTTFGATAEITGGNFNDREASASITGPIGDISAARLYVGWQKRDGWMNVNTGAGPNSNDRANDRNMFTVRGQYRVTPNDNIDVVLIGDYSKRNEVCCVGVATVLGPFAGIANAIASVPPLGGQPGATAIAAGGGYQAYSNYPWGQQVRDTGFSAQIDWNLGFGKFTSITAWRDNTVEAGNDTDYTAIDLLWSPDTKANQTDFKQFSQELRLAGKEGPLNWLVGGFFANETLTSNQTLWAGKDLDLYLSGVVGAAGGLPNPFAAPPLGLPLLTELTGQPPGSLLVPGVAGYSDTFRQTSKSFAFFSNETYTITQGLDLTAGIRYTHEKKDLTSNYNDTDGGAGCGQILSSTSPLLGTLNAGQDAFLYGYGCSVIFNPFFNKKADSQSLSENNVSGTVKLAYRFNEDVMAYLSVADGYKAGGFNLARVTNPFAPTFLGTLQPVLDTSFPKETVDSYELGIKTTLADHTLRLDAAVFDQRYKDFQLNTYTGILFVVSSIPHVESKGAEFNVAWATPLSGLSLSGGVTYAFTNITEFGNAAYLFAPNTADPNLPRLNNRLSFAPLWSGVASATYRAPITSSLEFRASVSEKYNSSYNTGSDLDPRKLQGAYGILNGRIGVAAPDDKWAVEAWGANLADKYYYQVAFDAPYQYNQIDAFLGAPRTFGLTARVKF
ncbi:MAG TPA: TonB-dependent receptor [Bryobacteraceae bacterium]|jgi:outer membrane receptor protein involved in Fe transport|nr:TonB-dependent receptor [Bryobacteraceae bacterium]